MLEIRLLGQFSIRLDGAEVLLAARPAQALLAYLLLNLGAAQRRERLAGVLWPDSNEASARRNLRQALWQIRRALGEASERYLLADDLTITFNSQSPYWLDCALIASRDDPATSADEWIRLVAAYAGELLPGFYDDWVVLERERLQAQFEQKMDRLLASLVTAARWPDVLHWGERWIALGHTPEPAYRALMQAHAARGDLASVAEIYRRCEEALQRDLAVAPSGQTRTLYQQLRRGVGVPAPSAPPALPGSTPRHNLPVQFSSFVGRQRELAELHRLLAECQLLTLTGPGGTGKTRLAIECATRLGTDPTSAPRLGLRFPDGVWLVELAQLADAELIPQRLATILGVREEPNYPLLQSILEQLRSKTLLLILDNCEHLVESCARLVAALLHTCPQVKILATSRETLGMTGETVFRVPSLTLPDLRNLPAPDQLAHYEAIRLFVERATTVKLDFQLTTANAPAIAQICHQLDGVPLAIELAAARVRTMTVEQVAARLDDRFRLLTGGSRTALPRQQTLRATIDWSWDLLTAAERTLLRRLAVFWHGWTLDAAEAVGSDDDPANPGRDCQAPPAQSAAPAGLVGVGTGATPNPQAGIQQANVLELLTHLVEKSLVLVSEEAGEARYYLLVTIRQYALEKLLEAGEAAAVRTRHLAFFQKWAATAAPHLRAAGQLRWLALLESEHDNLRAALNWATATAAVVAGLQLAGNLGRFWYLRGYWQEGREWLRQLLAQGVVTATAPPDLVAARILALNAAGWLANDDGSEAAFYSESLALCRRSGDRWGEAFALRGLSPVSANWNTSEQTLPNLYASRAIFQEIGDAWGVALVNFTLGWLQVSDDQHAAAEQSWQEGLTLFRQTGDCWGIAVTLSAQGYLARLYGQYGAAAELTKESQHCFRALGDQAGIVLTTLRLSTLALRRGDYEQALALAAESLQLEQQRGDQEGVALALQLQGLVKAYQGDYAAAHTLLTEGLAQARQHNGADDVGNALAYLGFGAYLQNDLTTAASYVEESLTELRAAQERIGLDYATYVQGLVALRQGNLAAARAALHQSLALSQAGADQRALAADLDALGQLALAQGESATATTHLQAALRLRRRMGDKQGLVETLTHLAYCTPAAHTAIRLLSAADHLRHTLGAPLPPVEAAAYAERLTTLRTQLDPPTFACWWTEGHTLPLDQIIAEALGPAS